MCLLASLVFSSFSRFLSFSFSMTKRIWTHCAWERASAIVQIDDCRHPAGRSVFLPPSLPVVHTYTTDENQAKRWERDEEKNVKIASWFEGQNVSWETEKKKKKKKKTMPRQRHQYEACWQRTQRMNIIWPAFSRHHVWSRQRTYFFLEIKTVQIQWKSSHTPPSRQIDHSHRQHPGFYRLITIFTVLMLKSGWGFLFFPSLNGLEGSKANVHCNVDFELIEYV